MEFKLRWIEIAFGAWMVLKLFRERTRFHFNPPADPTKLSWAAAAVFTTLGALAKHSQVVSGRVAGQDFWLFADMLAQTWAGAPFLTRYAPQATGFVQHGAVHPFLPLAAYAPLAGLAGPEIAATVLNASALALGGLLLFKISRPRWGEKPALALQLAFYFSSEVGRLHTYEAHPETLYPALTFLWIACLRSENRTTRFIGGNLALAFAMTLKADAALVFFPLIAWLRAWKSIPAAALGLTGAWAATRGFASGSLGPTETWLGIPITVPSGPELVGGESFTGPIGAWRAFAAIAARHAGPWDSVVAAVSLFGRGVFWNLMLHVPAILLRPSAAIAWLPLTLFLGWAGGQPANLMNHYSAPLVAVFWAIVATLPLGESKTSASRLEPFSRPTFASAWALTWALLLGSGGIEFFTATPEFASQRDAASRFPDCLTRLAGVDGRGVIPSRFLHVFPPERVYSDRAPRSQADWDRIEFLVLSRTEGSYELPAPESLALERRLSGEGWVRYGDHCEPDDHRPLGLWLRKR